MMASACGYACRKCGYCCSWIRSEDIVHIVELECQRCGCLFAVEVN